MNTTERDYAWYVMDGKEGILADINNPKLAGIEPIEDDGSIGFYAFADIPEGTEITAEDVLLELSDRQAGEAHSGFAIVYEEIVNPENEQRLIYEFVDKDWYEDSLFERMLCTETSKYYDWTSDRTRFIDSQANEETFKAEVEAEWEEICSEYKGMNHYSEAPDFDEIWKEITDLRDARNPDWDKSYIEEGVNYFTSEEEYHKEAEELEVDYYLISDNMAGYKYQEDVFANDDKSSEPYTIYGLTDYENQFFVDSVDHGDMFFLDVSLDQVKKFLIYNR